MSLIPEMTSNTEPSGLAFASDEYSADRGAYKAFMSDLESINNLWLASAEAEYPRHLGYRFDELTTVTSYKVYARQDATNDRRNPKIWKFQGSCDGDVYTTLDKHEKQHWDKGESVTREIAQPQQYRYYRLLIIENIGPGGTSVQKLEMFNNLTDYNYLKLGDKYVRIEGDKISLSDDLSYVEYPINLKKGYYKDGDIITIKELAQSSDTPLLVGRYTEDDTPHSLSTTQRFDLLNDDFLKSEDAEILVMHDKESEPLLNVDYVPEHQLLLASGDIKIESVGSINHVKVEHDISEDAQIKVISSVDGGTTWQAFNGEWYDVGPNRDDVLASGTPIDEFNDIPPIAWNEYRGESDIVRFGYLINVNDGDAMVKSIGMSYDAHGEWTSVYHGEWYDYKYVDNSTLVVNLKKDGDFKINY